MKVELRGHDRQVETIVFAPVNSYPFIRTLIGSQVRPRLIHKTYIHWDIANYLTKDATDEPGAYVVTGARDNLIMLWETQSGRHLKTLVCLSCSCQFGFFRRGNSINKAGHDGWIRGLVFHPTGKFLISASDDKHIRAWELESGRCIKVTEAHSHFVTCIAWGNAVVGGASNGDGSAEGGSGRNTSQGRRVNVVATGGVDLLVKIWTP